MKPKVNLKNGNRGYFIAIAVCLIVMFALSWMKQSPAFIEQYYSRQFYPLFSHLPKWLFGWLPFSIGDIFYVLISGSLLWIAISSVVALVKRRWGIAQRRLMLLVLVLLGTYIYFYVSWGLNYYRVPLQQQLGLQIDTIVQEDYVEILDRYITEINQLRKELDTTLMDKSRARHELQQLMEKGNGRLPMLSPTQVRAKQPLSSTLVSYFTVTGYFNPFTQEVQVNGIIPKTSYPFTVVHELAHQMGIGFEDECNFIAFLMLRDHSNVWYRYAAYYETVQYLLRPLYFQDKALYTSYMSKLSPEIRSDYEEERLFWQQYYGTFNRLTSLLYGSYLRHNNQPEGMARYSLMNRLVIAWEKQQTP
ncbi:DUF3810 domain-containing protein [Sphingobacterium sp. DN00404]|uniref:DUF3810 domain-containing protein n=1 Tax=Sphingobacterium micropteri TaxID=2763501 RepID=A0ABR7YQM3_9SPHI|nr:DUF3810 domain-containing protein [Sphingobacterium micropteri]MBD1433640.1 DUF3810 domain-containing protein [Sphingobacterium micropteri]